MDKSGSKFQIRKAGATDLAAIQNIAESAYSIYLDRMPTKPFPMLDDYSAHINEGTIHVLEDDTGVMGYVVLLLKEPENILLDNIAVSPDAQKKGYGRELAMFAEEMGRRKGCKSIYLYTNEVMSENLVWYARLGYEETHRAVEGAYKRIYMRKALQT